VSASGVKRALLDVHGHLPTASAVALCGGVALYLVALSAFKRRNVGSFNRQRLVAAAALVALIPAAAAVPALVAVGLVTGATCGLIAFEFFRYATARDRIRHGT
jgi:low temperature requirement protein LtrA